MNPYRLDSRKENLTPSPRYAPLPQKRSYIVGGGATTDVQLFMSRKSAASESYFFFYSYKNLTFSFIISGAFLCFFSVCVLFLGFF